MASIYAIDETMFESVNTWVTEKGGANASDLLQFIHTEFVHNIALELEDVNLEVHVHDDDTNTVYATSYIGEHEICNEYTTTTPQEHRILSDLISYLCLRSQDEENSVEVLETEIGKWEGEFKCVRCCPFIAPGPFRNFIDHYNHYCHVFERGWIRIIVRTYSDENGEVDEKLILQLMHTDIVTGINEIVSEYAIEGVGEDMKAFTRIAYAVGMELEKGDIRTL
jgi:hypothetical protein